MTGLEIPEPQYPGDLADFRATEKRLTLPKYIDSDNDSDSDLDDDGDGDQSAKRAKIARLKSQIAKLSKRLKQLTADDGDNGDSDMDDDDVQARRGDDESDDDAQADQVDDAYWGITPSPAKFEGTSRQRSQAYPKDVAGVTPPDTIYQPKTSRASDGGNLISGVRLTVRARRLAEANGLRWNNLKDRVKAFELAEKESR